jgi:hypothetical protein
MAVWHNIKDDFVFIPIPVKQFRVDRLNFTHGKIPHLGMHRSYHHYTKTKQKSPFMGRLF